jgi:hypothetical protein
MTRLVFRSTTQQGIPSTEPRRQSLWMSAHIKRQTAKKLAKAAKGTTHGTAH